MTGPADLTGQRALVTGAARGIGTVIARRLAAAGAHVFVNYLRSEAAARDTVAAIASTGGRATLAPGNLADPEGLAAMMAPIAADGLDVLVHNAAIGSFKPLHAVRANQWDLTLNVNARALLLCVQAALPGLARAADAWSPSPASADAVSCPTTAQSACRRRPSRRPRGISRRNWRRAACG